MDCPTLHAPVTADAHTQARCTSPGGVFHCTATARAVHATARPSTFTEVSPYRTQAVTGSARGGLVSGWTSSSSSSSLSELGVLSHQVGDTRLMGVPPMPVWIRSVL